MKVYSPSQTETFLFCQLRRELHYDVKARPRGIGKRDISALMGKAFAVGMALWHGAENPPEACSHRAITAAQEDLSNRIERGHLLYPDARAMVEAIPVRLKKAVERTISANHVLPSTVLGAEQDLGPEAGYSRPDLIVREDPALPPFAIDYKLRISIDARYRDAEVEKFRRSWQMFHYSYFIGKRYNTPVQEYGVVFTMLEPAFLCTLERYTVHPEALVQWHVFAMKTWERMERIDNGEDFATGQTNCRDQYGPCEYKRWCWELFGDEGLVTEDYIIGGKT